jgi:hypothetical protein
MHRTSSAVVAALVGLLVLSLPAAGSDPVVRIEEDWELQVKIPNNDVTAPQIITAWSPLGDLSGVHATFEINHIASVAFSPGGLHLSTWCGDTHLAVAHAGNFASMYTDGEVVRWTQAMEVQEGQLIFEIRNGTSQTWSSFSEADSLRLSLSTTLVDLDNYNPTVSIAKSEVSYAGNRVQSLQMRRVRFIHASGQTDTENAQRYVHKLDE